MSTKIRLIFSAHGSDAEGRNGRLIGYYGTKAAADLAAKGQGWGDGNVDSVSCIEVDGELFILKEAKPVKLDTKYDKTMDLKKSAISKLTKEELAALGIKVP